MANKTFKIIKGVFTFPVLKIIFGVALINVSAFITRSLIQLLLSSLDVTNDLILSSGKFIIGLLTLFYVYTFFVWIYEKRKPIEIQFGKNSLKQLLLGSLIGFSCIGSILSINFLFGWISIDNINGSPDIFKGIYFTIFFALLQDIVYYLILFRITEKYLGTYLTILLTSIIFGFKHLLWPEYDFISGIFLFINILFIFSALYIKSRTIWIIFGFHFIYNFIQTIVIANFPVENIKGIINLNINGPVILTGNPSGFETSIIAVIFCVLIGGYYLIEIRKHEKFLSPIWIKKNNNAP